MPRLPQGHGHLGAVLLLEKGVVAHVVNVGVAANHPGREEMIVLQRLLQLLPLLGKAGVQQNAAVVIQPVKGDQLPAFQHPGAAFDLFQFHIASSLFSLWMAALPRLHGGRAV